METNYPLQWPVGVPRTPQRSDSAFSRRTIAQATKELMRELRLLRAQNIVVSCNMAFRKTDGLPKSDQRELDNDPGMAVYFTLQGRRICMPCDKWRRPSDNLYAIAKHVEAMRGQSRWGVGSVEQAFAGYAALPAPTAHRPWEDVLRVRGQGREARRLVNITAQYRKLAKECHPDNGGSDAAMAELNRAYADAKKEVEI